MIQDEEAGNFDTFKDCLSTSVVSRLALDTGGKRKRAVKGRKNEIKPVTKVDHQGNGESDAAELSEFIEYLAEEIFASLPAEMRTLSYGKLQNDTGLTPKYAVPLDSALIETFVQALPPTVIDSLCSYGLINDDSDLEKFLEPAFSTYVTAVTAPPPEHTPALTASRPDGCEICQREHLPLTYHHLIPRQAHAKAVKRGWHREWELNKVAWLCRACHSFVHKIGSNELLARELYSVDLLLERDDVQRWAVWVSKIRWKSR